MHGGGAFGPAVIVACGRVALLQRMALPSKAGMLLDARMLTLTHG